MSIKKKYTIIKHEILAKVIDGIKTEESYKGNFFCHIWTYFRWIEAIDIIYLKGKLSFQKFVIIAIMVFRLANEKHQNKPTKTALKNQ